MQRRNASSVRRLIASNLLVALLLTIVYGLTLYPLEIRSTIERSPDYPQGVWVLYPDAFAAPHSAPAEARESSARLLEASLAEGHLALESPLYRFAERFPRIYISRSLVELGLVHLVEGSLPESGSALLAQQGGPYALGESTPEGPVVGVAEILWSQLFITDAAMLKSVASLSELPGPAFLRFYLRPRSETERLQVLEAVQAYTGTTYTALPLYEFLAQDIFALEARQARLQRLAAVFLLACALLTLYAGISRRWFEEREVYRVERILGRPHRYFLRRWLSVSLGQWVWGTLCCTLFFLSLAALRGQDALLVGARLLPWGLSLTFFGTLSALAFALASSRFALARTTLDTKQTWLSSSVPICISFVVVFGVTYLFTDTFVQYIESEHAVRALGADQVLALTTPAAQTTFGSEHCERLSVTSCAAFGTSSIYLWTPETGLPATVVENDDILSTIFRFDPRSASALRLELTEGRFPTAGRREALITEQALRRVREHVPDFGIGSELEFAYQVVGTVRTPPEADLGVFESIYRAAVLVRQDAPDIPNEWFLSPSGESGLALQLSSHDDLDIVKNQVRQAIRDTEFYQPAAYAQTFAASVRGSLVRLAGLFTLALLLTGVAYWHFISATLAKRTLELSIWRLLGMNLRTLSRRLQRELLPLPFLSGLLACALGCLLLLSGYRAEVAPYALLCGLAATGLLTGLYSYLIRRSVQKMGAHEVDTLYREAL
jgi:sulfite exporter TauE/SafE